MASALKSSRSSSLLPTRRSTGHWTRRRAPPARSGRPISATTAPMERPRSAAATSAAALQVPLGVISFEPHTRKYFHPDEPHFRLTNADQLGRLLEGLGVDRLYILPFDATGTLLHGAHVFPDTNAKGTGEDPQWLYTVRFTGPELWGEDADPTVTVSVDAWDSYLEPAP